MLRYLWYTGIVVSVGNFFSSLVLALTKFHFRQDGADFWLIWAAIALGWLIYFQVSRREYGIN